VGEKSALFLFHVDSRVKKSNPGSIRGNPQQCAAFQLPCSVANCRDYLRADHFGTGFVREFARRWAYFLAWRREWC
jgi:hypothetical protein